MSSADIEETGKRLVEAGKRLHDRGLIIGTSGNVSIRIAETDTFLIKPSGKRLGFLKPEELVLVDMAGNKVQGEGNVSLETPMHAAIYRTRSDVKAIVHTHPPTATAFGIAGTEILPLQIEIFMLFPHGIPIVPFQLPGSAALAKAIQETIKDCDAVVLENHGIVTVGSDIGTACDLNEMVEEAAQVQQIAMMLAGKEAFTLTKLKKKFKTVNAVE